MCGLAGFIRRGGFDPESARAIGMRMGNAIQHRGPDDSGVWCDEQAGVLLSHRRLSIIDVSAAGHQPMVSVSGRYVIAYNGEVYNHAKLRAQMQTHGLRWRGHSDTETLLAGFDAWGIGPTIERSTGMFAFAVWDRQERALVLGRDRLGEKPLYYGVQGEGAAAVFLFGSQLKALEAHPDFNGTIDRGALCLLMRHNYIPAPHSIYRDIHKLTAGHLLEISLEDTGIARRILPASRPYWSLQGIATGGGTVSRLSDDAEATDALDGLLRDAIGQQMIADVPLGAFLSGGIDSSTVVALMQAQSTTPVKTFTVGFNEAGYDEAGHAKAVARHLGTEHTELYVPARDALAVVPRLPTLFDEPFADSSQIPTFLVSQLARQRVTVSLSGDAGDELFGGYSRYTRAQQVWRMTGRLPPPIRAAAVAAIRSVPVVVWNAVASPLQSLMPSRVRSIGDKAHKFADLIDHPERLEFYRSLVSHWQAPDRVVLESKEPDYRFNLPPDTLAELRFPEAMMLADSLSYLPDDILTKVDRAAMGVSLETRVPLLDHRVVEFAWSLPLHMKVRQGVGKWILRQVLYRYVPRALIDRPKKGFSVPLADWLRGPLRDWAEPLLAESRLRHEGFLDPVQVRKKWIDHLSGLRDWQYQLWNVLMFQAWLDRDRAR